MGQVHVAHGLEWLVGADHILDVVWHARLCIAAHISIITNW